MNDFKFWCGVVLLIYSISTLLNYWILRNALVNGITKSIFDESDLSKEISFDEYLKLLIFVPIFNTIYFLLFIGGIIWGVVAYPFSKKDNEEENK